MITSDVNSSALRPASPGAATSYRSASREIVAAAVRAQIAYPKPPSLKRLDTSRYEFPGDRTYQRYLEAGL